MSRLLVTNCTNDPETGGVYLLDTASGDVRRVHTEPTRGITHGPDGFYTVGNQGAIYHLDPVTWKSTLRITHDLNGSHDLRWFDPYFYLVASHGNQVLRLDRNLQILDRMQIVEDEGDVCHANCLIQVNGQLLLSIFTLSPGRREAKRHSKSWRTEGKVLRLNWEEKSFDVLFEPLGQPHSLIWRDDCLYCCESYTSDISVMSPKERKKQPLRRMHGFVRGLVFAGDRAYVGISRARVKMSLMQKLRLAFKMQCGVVELDPHTWQPKRQFKIPGKEVYELLAVDE